MQDNTKAVLQAFGAYAAAFETLLPENVTPFFHPNATLMTAEVVAFMSNEADVKGVFQNLFYELKGKAFDHSKMNSIQVRQLSENQAIVSGSATRYNNEGKAFESFGLTYTLRHEGVSWKIIFGVLHEQVLLLTA